MLAAVVDGGLGVFLLLAGRCSAVRVNIILPSHMPHELPEYEVSMEPGSDRGSLREIDGPLLRLRRPPFSSSAAVTDFSGSSSVQCPISCKRAGNTCLYDI